MVYVSDYSTVVKAEEVSMEIFHFENDFKYKSKTWKSCMEMCIRDRVIIIHCRKVDEIFINEKVPAVWPWSNVCCKTRLFGSAIDCRHQ